jgi:hypothetical protein
VEVRLLTLDCSGPLYAPAVLTEKTPRREAVWGLEPRLDDATRRISSPSRKQNPDFSVIKPAASQLDLCVQGADGCREVQHHTDTETVQYQGTTRPVRLVTCPLHSRVTVRIVSRSTVKVNVGLLSWNHPRPLPSTLCLTCTSVTASSHSESHSS